MADNEAERRQHQSVENVHQSADKSLERLCIRARPPSQRSPQYAILDRCRKEIRLLRIKAGRGCQRLRCELEHAFLDSSPIPQYETISYCWGNPKKKTRIALNGRRVEVTASSKAALRCMRLTTADRIVWIDAICINQCDIDERTRQVSFMHEIYANGGKNLIYLGKNRRPIRNGLEIIQQVLENARYETSDYETWPRALIGASGEYRLSSTGIALPDNLKPLFIFFSAPWFGRLWVAQEAALSRNNTCYYGRCEAPLEDVLRVARWLEHKSRFLPFYMRDEPGLQNASAMFEFSTPGLQTRQFSNAKKFTLIEVLDYVRDLVASDPRDRIYAILGLHNMLTGSSVLTNVVPPDYHQTLRNVLRDAARYAIQERCDLFIFNYIEIFPVDTSYGETWPSWVPHWHIKEADEVMPRGLAEVFNADDGCALKVEKAIGDSDPDLLVLTGYAVGTASTVLPASQYEAFWDGQELCRIIENIRVCLELSAVEPSDLGATLISGTTHNSERATEAYCDKFSAFLNFLQETHQIPEPPEAEQNHGKDQLVDLESLWAYHQALYNALDNRCFFSTTAASMGVGPRTMQSRDIIAALYGSRWPVVLRSVDNGQYRVLGTCYVHGIMDGEAVRRFKAQGRAEDEFVFQ